jgi:hypothetical protein
MTRGIAEIHADLEHCRAAITNMATRRRAASITPEDLVWAALTIANDSSTCTSILAGRPVLTSNLDPTRLYHAQRGAPTPTPDEYTTITKDMLLAVIEAGPNPSPPQPVPDNVVEIGSQPPRIRVPRTWIPR